VLPLVPLLAAEPLLLGLLEDALPPGVLDEALPDPLVEGWSLLELELDEDGELEEGEDEDGDEGELEELELALLSLLSLLFIARLPLPLDPDEPGVLDVLPDCERRESLPRSQADSPKVAASAAANAVRTNFLCTMSTIS
jgi:hypothetical protein